MNKDCWISFQEIIYTSLHSIKKQKEIKMVSCFFADTHINWNAWLQMETHTEPQCEKPPGWNKTAAASRVGPQGDQ